MAREEANKEREITLDYEKKEVESKSTWKDVLAIIFLTQSNAVYYPNLGIEANITRDALHSISVIVQP